jgi:formylglycine-generating enzyme required for sulfatase activity
VRDWFDAYPSSAQTNPQGPGSGTMRVIRGGAWSNGAAGVRSSSRAGFLPGATSDIVGFRVARDPYAVRVPAWATLIESQPDPSVVTDPVLRASIFATGLAWRVRDVATQIELVLIPPGTFQMGCVVGSDMYACTDNEQPVHQVTLTKAFYLGRHEVTQAQWTAKMGSNPSYFQGYPDSPSRPVERVGWYFIREQSFFGFPPRRLPTEAEWEFACRAGTSTPFYNGATNDATVTNLGWIAQNSGGETHAVGGKLANGLGLYDMLGNVSEWVNDRFGGYTSAPQIDPSGPVGGSNGVFRGGSCFMDTYWARSSNRDRYHSTSYNIGFRIAIDP